jgi:hypothetical protein
VRRPRRLVALTVFTSFTTTAVLLDTEYTHKLTGVDRLHAEALVGKGTKIG